MSLDKDASSDPNLKAVHAGASMRKAQHLQPKASDIEDAEVGCFAFSRLAAHIRVLSKSGEKPTLPAKRSLPPKIPGTRVPKFGAAPWFSHEAAVSAVHRGDGDALAESTPNCGLPTSLNHLRGFSPRFINTSEVREEVPSTDPPARAGFCVP